MPPRDKNAADKARAVKASVENALVKKAGAEKVRVNQARVGHVGEKQTHMEHARVEKARVGLCLDCRHARKVESDRGSNFYLCALSESDPAFPKYPPLPVIQCSGHSPKA